MQLIPLSDTASQTVYALLGGQNCRVNVYAKSVGVFCDLYVQDKLIVGGVSCLNLVRIVRDAYLGFKGDLFFMDSQGSLDPTTPGIGSRFLLYYLEASDL